MSPFGTVCREVGLYFVLQNHLMKNSFGEQALGLPLAWGCVCRGQKLTLSIVYLLFPHDLCFLAAPW